MKRLESLLKSGFMIKIGNRDFFLTDVYRYSGNIFRLRNLRRLPVLPDWLQQTDSSSGMTPSRSIARISVTSLYRHHITSANHVNAQTIDQSSFFRMPEASSSPIILSASRIEETSGVVTTMERCAPAIAF